MLVEVESNEFPIMTYGGQPKNAGVGECKSGRKEALSKQIESGWSFGELRENCTISKQIKSGEHMKNQNGKKKLGRITQNYRRRIRK